MRGITIQIEVKRQVGVDLFNQPAYESSFENVDDVLVGEPSSTDIENNLTMYGKRTAYTLAIPKGDAHEWEDIQVILPAPFSDTFRTIGQATAGIEENIPLRWNKKVHLERVEG